MYVIFLVSHNMRNIERDIDIFDSGLLVAFKPYYAVLIHFYASLLKRYITRLKTHPWL